MLSKKLDKFMAKVGQVGPYPFESHSDFLLRFCEAILDTLGIEVEED